MLIFTETNLKRNIYFSCLKNTTVNFTTSQLFTRMKIFPVTRIKFLMQIPLSFFINSEVVALFQSKVNYHTVSALDG